MEKDWLTLYFYETKIESHATKLQFRQKRLDFRIIKIDFRCMKIHSCWTHIGGSEPSVEKETIFPLNAERSWYQMCGNRLYHRSKDCF